MDVGRRRHPGSLRRLSLPLLFGLILVIGRSAPAEANPFDLLNWLGVGDTSDDDTDHDVEHDDSLHADAELATAGAAGANLNLDKGVNGKGIGADGSLAGSISFGKHLDKGHHAPPPEHFPPPHINPPPQPPPYVESPPPPHYAPPPYVENPPHYAPPPVYVHGPPRGPPPPHGNYIVRGPSPPTNYRAGPRGY